MLFLRSLPAGVAVSKRSVTEMNSACYAHGNRTISPFLARSCWWDVFWGFILCCFIFPDKRKWSNDCFDNKTLLR